MENIVVLIDGASASGKSTMKNALLKNKNLNFEYVKRYTTRSHRADDDVNDDYIFVSKSYFDDLEKSNSLVEFRHFDFGMSYGIGRKEIQKVIDSGKNALGLMNLGNVKNVKRNFPEAICVLIDVPMHQIEQRLYARNSHTEAQVIERVHNAQEAQRISHHYDIVIDNSDGNSDIAINTLISDIIKTKQAA